MTSCIKLRSISSISNILRDPQREAKIYEPFGLLNCLFSVPAVDSHFFNTLTLQALPPLTGGNCGLSGLQ